MRITPVLIPALALVALAGPSPAMASADGNGTGTGGSSGSTTVPGAGGSGTGGAGVDVGGGVGAPSSPASTPLHPTVPGFKAKIIHGVVYAPSYAPIQVQKAIWAGNQIRLKPYIYAGGHGVWNDAGYDCSGSVSFVLHAAGLLKASVDSTGFESWGRGGHGQWITVYTNPAHAFIQIAGIRMDTSAGGDPNPPPGTGPRWRPVMHGTGGFQARHPANL